MWLMFLSASKSSFSFCSFSMKTDLNSFILEVTMTMTGKLCLESVPHKIMKEREQACVVPQSGLNGVSAPQAVALE